MAEFPSMPVWTDALMGDTAHLDTEQFGAYFLMLMVAWRSPDNSLPVDDAQLARVCRLSLSKWRRSRDVLLAFWRVDEGRLRQKNLDKVKNSVKVNVQQKSDAGRASALKRQQTASTAVDEPLQREGQRNSTNQNQNQTDEAKASSAPLPPKGGAELKLDLDPPAKPKEPKNGKRLIPPDWQPDAAAHQLAASLGVDLNACLGEFLDWVKSKRPMYADWQATFRNSLRRASQSGRFRKQGGAGFGREAAGVVNAGVRVSDRYKEKLASGV